MYIDTKQLKEITNVDYYDGHVLHSRFAYKFLKKNVSATGDIIAFVAPMEVTAALVDLEDAMNADYIFSDLAINFLIELPNVDLFGAVCFQRLFNTYLGSLLSQTIQKELFVDGDDIMVITEEGNKKASVSIAHNVLGASLIHTGINIEAGRGAPSFAYSTNLTKEATDEFINKSIQSFYDMSRDIFIATTKVIA